MKIGFWSPVPGMAGVSSTVVAMAVLSSSLDELERSSKILLQTSANQYNGVQRPLLGKIESVDDNFYFSNLGIDAITRHISSGDRTAATIADCCVKVNSTLSYVPATSRTKQVYEGDIERYVTLLTTLMDKYYNLSFYDIEAGFSTLSLKFLHAMDFIVVCLPQNMLAIEMLQENAGLLPKNAGIYYLMTNHDMDSAYTKRNICKVFGYSKQECGIVPYCSEFKDALNQGSVVSFLTKYYDTTDKESAVYTFISECRASLMDILKRSGAIEVLEKEEGGV